MLPVVARGAVPIGDYQRAQLPVEGAAELVHTRASLSLARSALVPIVGDAAVNQRGAKYPRSRVKQPLSADGGSPPRVGGSGPQFEARRLVAADDRVAAVERRVGLRMVDALVRTAALLAREARARDLAR